MNKSLAEVKRSSDATPPTRTIKIRPGQGWSFVDMGELWEYRDLLYILVWRDIKVRYKQTAIGVAWVVIQPLVMMLIFTVFFGLLIRVPSSGIPYPVFAYAALLIWQFFAKALTEASTSLVVNERVISKVYFPRLLVPTAVVLAGIPDFLIACIIMVGLMLFYSVALSWLLLVVPLFLFLAVLLALGVSYWLAALDVEYRDVRYTLPFLTQVWFFVTPVVYPATAIPEQWRILYGLNPMVGVIEGFRWALLGTPPPSPSLIAVALIATLVVFLTGVLYFRRAEDSMTDAL